MQRAKESAEGMDSTRLRLCSDWAVFAALFLVFAVPPQSCAYTDVTVEEAYLMLSLNASVFLLDVRAQSEYDVGHIGGAYLIPNNQMEARVSELPSDRSWPILVYCAVGGRSASASGVLTALGYENVSNMAGGFTAWKAAGYPFVVGPQPGIFQIEEGWVIAGAIGFLAILAVRVHRGGLSGRRGESLAGGPR